MLRGRRDILVVVTWNRLIATSGILLGLAAGLLSCGVSFVKGTAKVKLRGIFPVHHSH